MIELFSLPVIIGVFVLLVLLFCIIGIGASVSIIELIKFIFRGGK